MTLTYVAVTAAIVLGTLVIFLLLSWGRSPEETEIEAPEPPSTADPLPAPTPKLVRPAPAKAGKTRRKTT